MRCFPRTRKITKSITENIATGLHHPSPNAIPIPIPICLCHCLCHNSHICHPLRTTHPSLSSHSHLLASQPRVSEGGGRGVKREVEPFKRAYTYRFLFHFYPCSTLSYTACLPSQCLSLPLAASAPDCLLPASCLPLPAVATVLLALPAL